jgi:hypothetical protein
MPDPIFTAAIPEIPKALLQERINWMGSAEDL